MVDIKRNERDLDHPDYCPIRELDELSKELGIVDEAYRLGYISLEVCKDETRHMSARQRELKEKYIY